MAKIGEKTWIWLTAAQPSLGYAFYDMAVPVLALALLTHATN